MVMPGVAVQVSDPKVMTRGKFGVTTGIIENNKIQIDFGEGWVGYYTLEQLYIFPKEWSNV